MAVSVEFGTSSSACNKIHKATSLGTAKSCEVKQPCSVESPYFIVDSGSVSNTDNYCKCGDFGRYYYIQNIDELPGHRKGVQCVCDPLMSFAAEIDALEVNVERHEGSTESDIYDNGVCQLAKKEVVIQKFSGGEFSKASQNDRCYILVVAN